MWQTSGCQRAASREPALTIAHDVSPWPARVGAASIQLHVRDAAGHAATGLRIGLEADMSHPGMRPEFGEAREQAAGIYQGRIAFSMPGDWVILMHIALPSGQKLERQWEVHGVRAN